MAKESATIGNLPRLSAGVSPFIVQMRDHLWFRAIDWCRSDETSGRFACDWIPVWGHPEGGHWNFGFTDEMAATEFALRFT